jgi:hypothetical protein
MATFEEICKANETIKTTDIKGKAYAEVNQRIKAFRMVYPNGTIATELLSDKDGICVFKAMVYADNDSTVNSLLGTGHAYEKESSSYINKTSYIENCETSAVGRALAMAGFGIDTSISSAEEVTNAINNQQDKEEVLKGAKAKTEVLKILNEKIKNNSRKYVENVLEHYGIKGIEEITVEIAEDFLKSVNSQ